MHACAERELEARRSLRNFQRLYPGSLGVLLVVLCTSFYVGGAGPLPAHSHNDYRREKPLEQALELGFRSIEADIHLVKGELLVGHDPEDLEPSRTLEALYLAPLLDLAKKHGGTFYHGEPLILLIDLKTDGQKTFPVLQNLLGRYQEILTHWREGQVRTGAVTVILSGNRPRELLMRQTERLAAYDGRLVDLGTGATSEFMPLVSDNWKNHFKWDGNGDMPEEERAKLQHLVRKAHTEGKMIRFWAAPDVEPVWREQVSAGVDLINTDRLQELAEFLQKKQQEEAR